MIPQQHSSSSHLHCSHCWWCPAIVVRQKALADLLVQLLLPALALHLLQQVRQKQQLLLAVGVLVGLAVVLPRAMRL